jgi:nicotinamidase-related amidase
MTQIPPYVARWFEELKPLAINEAVPDPSRAGVFSVDMIAGFLSTGNLASERVGRLAQPVAEIFQRAYQRGIRQFLLFQDAHHPQAPEFDAFPPHCVQGSEESTTIPELQALPFSNSFTIIEKNSINPAVGTRFDKWLDEHRHVNTALVVGNCTDLCVYQLAMHLRLRANALNYRHYQVIVPANTVDTYDLGEDVARQTSSYAHPGDFFHQVFLYHMALNGIRVVRKLT